MDISERFWNASLEELKRGYIEEADLFICLLCGESFEQGRIYPDGGNLYEAERYARIHIEQAHQSVFDFLIGMSRQITGLTDHQRSLLKLYYQGKTDAEVKQEMGIGSASTLRNHRFTLKGKERQAKVFLAIMELLKEKDKQAPAFVDVHQTARMVDDRYNTTREESEELLNRYFPDGRGGPLHTFPAKEKHKLVVLRHIAGRFERGRIYREKDVNEVLKQVYHDYVTIRRYLIEYGFMDRKPGGSEYWLK